MEIRLPLKMHAMLHNFIQLILHRFYATNKFKTKYHFPGKVSFHACMNIIFKADVKMLGKRIMNSNEYKNICTKK